MQEIKDTTRIKVNLLIYENVNSGPSALKEATNWSGHRPASAESKAAAIQALSSQVQDKRRSRV